VAADWDSSGIDAGTDTIKISETSSAATADAYDIDPDTANYAAGNDPDIAYRNQGHADSPNGWGGRPSPDAYQDDNYTDGTSEHDQPHETAYDEDTPDLWGDTDPDAAIYADLYAQGISKPDGLGKEDNAAEDRGIPPDARQPGRDEPATASREHDQPDEADYDDDLLGLWGDTDPDAANYADLDGMGIGDSDRQQRTSAVDAGQPGQAESAGVDTSDRLSPEQQRIHALETENAAANQQIADLKADKDELTARLDLIEQHPASNYGYQDRETRRPDHGADEPDSSREQDALLDERIATGQRADAKREEQTRWRRAASAENVGAVGTLLGAADLAMHGMPGLAVALGATAIGVVSWGQAKIEKRGKGKQ